MRPPKNAAHPAPLRLLPGRTQALPHWRGLTVGVLAVLTGIAGCGGPSGGGYSSSNYTIRRTYHPAPTGPYVQAPKTVLNPAQAPAVLHDPRLVRVHLLSGVEAFDLTIDGAVEVLDATGQSLERFDRIAPQPVTLIGTSLAIGNRIFYGADRLQLKLNAAHGRIDDEDLGSSLRLVTIYRNQGERKLHCVVSWGVEDYLYGVLSGEVPVDWPAEALKAQAVASRTYVLYQMQDRRYEDFDVERTIHSQVFKTGDLRKIDPRVIAAVDATRGEYLTSDGELFPTYFHSTCGGVTASAQDVFGGAAPAALAGHRSETACAGSSVYRWQRSFPLSEFETRLSKKGLWDAKTGGAIENILPTGSMEAGGPMRATRFEIIGEKARKVVAANDFRLAFGGGRNDLPSTLFSGWVVRKKAVTIDGQGWGHGVGMCQFGAMGRAKAGEDYRAILRFYYRGAQMKQAESKAEQATRPAASEARLSRVPA